MGSEFLAFLYWYISAIVLGLLALPLTSRLFRRMPDRGYSLTKTFGLLLVGYIFWLSGSLGFTQNDAGGIVLAAGLMLAVGLLWLRLPGLSDLKTFFYGEKKIVLAVEILFLAAFAGWALVRAYNPNIEGTEKPMEFMFINSVLQSPSFPPHDAWLSGHAVSYYYFGYLLIAMLTRLTGVEPGLAFNLGISLLFALTAVNAFGLVLNLISMARRKAAGLSRSIGPALLAPVLVLVVGNYYGAIELAHNNGFFREVRVPAVWYDFGEASGPVTSLDGFIRQPGIRAGTINLWEWLDLKRINYPPPDRQGPVRWDLPNWFFAARVVHDRSLIGIETEAIDENPAFSFLLADMHPHVLALPFVLLAAALALDWLLWARQRSLSVDQEPDPPSSLSSGLLPLLPRLVLSALVLGGLAFLNTWDFPIYFFLTILAIILGLGSAVGSRRLPREITAFLPIVLLLGLLSFVLYLPFYITLQSQAGGILPNLIYPTRFQQSVVMFGPVMAGVTIFILWTAFAFRGSFNMKATLWAGFGALISLILAALLLTAAGALVPGLPGLVDQFIHPLVRQEAVSLILQRRLVDSLASLYPALLIGVSVGIAAGLMVGPARENGDDREIESFSENPDEEHLLHNKWRAPAPALLMVLAMVVTGALLLIGPEFVYLRDFFGTRMNTLFKFYFQVWVLWSAAAAFGIWFVFDRASKNGRLWAVLAILAVLPGLVYLPGGLMAKTGEFSRPPTLDGMAYFAQFFPDDWAAIRWLEENHATPPVILEGTRGSYWIEGRSSRISMATGFPTLMGWIGHQHQWRGTYFHQVSTRPDHIRQIYQLREWETTEALLELYGIEYVLVSPLEREWYTPLYQPKFDRFMLPVFQQGSVIIYMRRGTEISPGG
jgi:YYY domain-containing protein